MSERTGHFRTFKPSHADSVKRCQDEVMGNIIHGIGVDSYDQISHEILNKRGLVSKGTSYFMYLASSSMYHFK